MNRREFVKLLGGLAMAPSLARGSTPDRIVVVGAGIVGASVAYHLARRGAQVTVIEKDRPAEHASGRSFAWINATYAKQPFSYHLLSRLGVSSYRSLHAELGLPIRWGGSVEWSGDPEQAELTEAVERQQAYGASARMVDAEYVNELEPNLTLGNTRKVAYSELDGAVDAAAASRIFLDHAAAAGASVLYPVRLTGIRTTLGRLTAVQTSTGDIDADRVVVAAGIDTESIAAFVGLTLPQIPRPGLIATSKPMRRVINRVVVAPGIHLHQRDDGRIVMGEQAGPPETDAHALRLRGRPRVFPAMEQAAKHGERMRAIGERFVPQLADALIESVVIGWRPMPTDGYPVIGASPSRPDVYFAVMHSGVTLAAITGELACIELLDDGRTDLLRDFRPGRFA